MKKILTSILFFACINATEASAQNFYFRAGLGYAFAMPGQKLDQYGNSLNGSVIHNATTTEYNLKNASYSSGMYEQTAGGYMFSNNIGVELGAGIDFSARRYNSYISGLTNTSGIGYDYTAQRQAQSIVILIPSLVLQTSNANCNVYMRMGLALPTLNTGIKLNETYIYQNGDVHQYDWDIANYFSLGFAGATGVKLKIKNLVSIWAEVSMTYLNLSREEQDLKDATINGTNYPTSQLSGIKNYSYNKNGISNSYGTEQALPQPFSNIGFNLGVTRAFSNHSKGRKNQIH